MVNQKWVAISYCFAFIAIYFLFVAYSLGSTMINNMSQETIMPQTVSMNATYGVTSFLSGGHSAIISLIAAIVIVVVILSIILSMRSMRAAFA